MKTPSPTKQQDEIVDTAEEQGKNKQGVFEKHNDEQVNKAQ